MLLKLCILNLNTSKRYARNSDGTYMYRLELVVDQGINIDAEYDYHAIRLARWKKLKKTRWWTRLHLFRCLGKWTIRNLSWPTHIISKKWSPHKELAVWQLGGVMVRNMTPAFQHWAADLTYGGYTLKGLTKYPLDSSRNHTKRFMVGDYPVMVVLLTIHY